MVSRSTDDEAFEQRVRAALREEADTVEPSGDGLRAIQARTRRDPAGRGSRTSRWMPPWANRWTNGAAVLATAAAVMAVAVAGLVGLGPDSDEDAAPAGPSGGTAALQVFYLDSTPEQRGEPGSVTTAPPGLYREVHEVEVEGDPVAAAVRELVASPPDDPDYDNPWLGTTLHGVESGEDQTVVDVGSLPAPGPVRQQALQALAHTVSAALPASGDAAVAVEVDGQPFAEVTPGEPLGTFAGIWLATPRQGESVQSPVTFSGLAATFEGNVAYEISRGERVVARGATITTGGMGVWSEWSFREALPPGEYTVAAFDVDPALGGRRDLDTKDFTVR